MHAHQGCLLIGSSEYNQRCFSVIQNYSNELLNFTRDDLVTLYLPFLLGIYNLVSI